MFEERVDDPEIDTLDWLWEHVAPDVVNRRRARTAALLTIASEGDLNGVRGRIHTLLVGAPGTGKTVIKDWVKNNMADAHGIGPDSSEAGMKFNANAGKPGKLHMAHEGILCAEEFEKFDKGDREAALEAMSDGYFEVDKGGVDAEFPAEVRMVAVANSMNPFSAAMGNRMDFVVHMDDYSEEETITVSTGLYDSFVDRFIREEPGHSVPVVSQYLSWVGPFRPGISSNAREAVREAVERLVRHGDRFHGDIRQKEAYMRLAYVIAKLNYRGIEASDWVRAVDLCHPDLDARSLFEDFL